MRKKYSLGINWLRWFMFLGGTIFEVILILKEYEPTLISIMDPEIAVFFLLVAFFKENLYYEFLAEGLTVKWAGLIRKNYHWNEIQQLIILREWWDGKRKRNDPILLITLNGYEPFAERIDSIITYRKNHSETSYMIYLSKKDLDELPLILNKMGRSVEEFGYYRI